MSAKRKKRGPSDREKIIERQALDSMELALTEFQESAEQNAIDDEDDPNIPQVGEFGVARAAEIEPRQEVESSVLVAETNHAVAASIASSEVAEPASGSAEAFVSAPTSQKNSAATSSQSTPIIGGDGLPQKTAHDPTSHITGDLSQEGDGSNLFWVFIFLLVLISFMVFVKG